MASNHKSQSNRRVLLQRMVRLLAMCLMSVAILIAIAGTAILSLLVGAITTQDTIHAERNGIIVAVIVFSLFWGIVWAASYLDEEA